VPFKPGRVELVVLAVASLVAFAAGEALARVAVAMSGAPRSTYQFYSAPYFEADSQGAVRHIRSQAFRLTTVYDESIEFDVKYRTNDLGFVDHQDYLPPRPPPAGARRYAFAGDSFVEGMGAEPWVPRLRDRLREAGADIEIYNLGLMGASLQHVRALLKSTAAEVPITDILIIVISNDFYRPNWVPLVTGDEVRFCRDPEACPGNGFTRLASYEASQEELIQRSRDLRAAQLGVGEDVPLWRRLIRKSELIRVVRRSARQLSRRISGESPATDLENPADLQDNLAALVGVRSDFPDLPIHLVRVPQKEEVVQGRYTLDVEREARAANIEYFPALTACPWTVDMFYPRDAHPNERGYAHLTRCVANYLAKTDETFSRVTHD
jgi:hypothetical protein